MFVGGIAQGFLVLVLLALVGLNFIVGLLLTMILWGFECLAPERSPEAVSITIPALPSD